MIVRVVRLLSGVWVLRVVMIVRSLRVVGVHEGRDDCEGFECFEGCTVVRVVRVLMVVMVHGGCEGCDDWEVFEGCEGSRGL